MNIYKAYKITRKFQSTSRLGTKFFYKPQIVKNVQIIKNKRINKYYFSDYYEDRLKNNPIFKRSSSKAFKKTKSEIIYDKNNNYLEIKKIEGNMALCSIGVISEEDFYLAEDIMESFEKVRKKDLIIGEKYNAINNKEYVFIGNSKLREVKSGKVVKFNSQKLIPVDSIWNEEF